MKRKFTIKKIIISILFIAFYIVCTVGPVVAHHFYEQMSWCWISFIWIFIYSPLLVLYFRKISLSKLNLTDQQIKKGNASFGLLILWYWFLDIVFMTIFNQWTVAMYILVSITILKIFYDLAISISNSKMRSKIFAPALILNFLIGIALVVYLIFKIPDEDLRNIVTAIVAAVFTGLITLVGVAWTIRHANEEKKDEEIKKNKPFIFIVDPYHMSRNKENVKVMIPEENISRHNLNKGKKYEFNSFILENSDYSHCTLKGFCINNDLIPLYIGQAFRKDEQYVFIPDFKFKYEKDINKVSLLLLDMLDNYYALEINFEFTKNNGTLGIDIKSGIELKKCNVDLEHNIITDTN